MPRPAVKIACLAFLACNAAHAQEGSIKVGLLTDMSGVFADADGPGGAEAVKMAVEDFGGEVLGQKITFLVADHQNKPDVGAAKAREWFDRDGVTMVLAGPNSSVALAVNAIARDKKRVFRAHPGSLDSCSGFCR